MSTILNKWVQGGCHCGAVRFKVLIRTLNALECNCSICFKKGFTNIITKADDFELLKGDENLGTYQFNTKVAEHLFCNICGIHPFSKPRSHPGNYDVNARCLDEGFEELSISTFDGQNWEESVSAIQ